MIKIKSAKYESLISYEQFKILLLKWRKIHYRHCKFTTSEA